MAEVNDEVEEVINNEDIDTTDDITDSPEEISYEQALEWKKKAERLEKAEKSLVEMKRKAKQSESTSSESGEFVTKAQLAIDKFLDKNPDLSDYTKELEQYSKKGLSLDEAKTLILSSDKARTNREKLNSLGLSD